MLIMVMRKIFGFVSERIASESFCQKQVDASVEKKAGKKCKGVVVFTVNS